MRFFLTLKNFVKILIDDILIGPFGSKNKLLVRNFIDSDGTVNFDEYKFGARN